MSQPHPDEFIFEHAHRAVRMLRRHIVKHGVAWPTIWITTVSVLISLALSFGLRALLGQAMTSTSLVLSTLLPLLIGSAMAWLTCAVVLHLDRRERIHRHRASHDALTELLGRRDFFAHCHRTLDRLRATAAQRTSSQTWAMMIDLDHFKRLNDEHGHLAGDHALRQLARICREELRPADIIGRYGGDELAVLIDEIDEAAILRITDRLRQRVQAATLMLERPPQVQDAPGVIAASDTMDMSSRLTISIGLSIVAPEEGDVAPALHRADAALREAKRAGRNQAWIFRCTARSSSVAACAGDCANPLTCVRITMPDHASVARATQLVSDSSGTAGEPSVGASPVGLAGVDSPTRLPDAPLHPILAYAVRRAGPGSDVWRTVARITAGATTLSVGLTILVRVVIGAPLDPYAIAYSGLIPLLMTIVPSWLFTTMINVLRRSEMAYEHLARHDALTGLLGRRSFFDLAQDRVGLAQSDQRPCWTLMIDLDRLKAINDQRGHHVGDQVLQHVARLAREGLRPSDLIGRYGGDELVALLADVDEDDALVIAERIRERIGSVPMRLPDGRALVVSASLGIARVLSDECTLALALSRADAALRQAKLDGRNRVGVNSAIVPAQTPDSASTEAAAAGLTVAQQASRAGEPDRAAAPATASAVMLSTRRIVDDGVRM